MSDPLISGALSEDIEYISRIRARYSSLSKKHKKIANYILSHPSSAACSSITLLAQKVGTSPSTVSRFCQTLSYKGFSELKLYMDKNLLSPGADTAMIRNSDPLPVILQKLMITACDSITDTLRTLNPTMLSLAAAELVKANTINFYGQSGGYISTLYGQQMLLRVGVLSQAINDNVDMQIAATTLKKGDVAVGIAYSGEVRSVISALESAKKNGAVTVAITANPNSSMAKLAHYPLLYSYDIPDDLRYLHLGSMCEISVLGAIQAEILRDAGQRARLEACRDIVLQSRMR